MEMNRRQFITTTVAGAAGAMMARGAVGAERALSANPFQIVPIGKSGLKSSLIGIGTGMRGGGRQSNHTRMGKEKFEALVKYAYDQGVRFFDCADMYGTNPYLPGALKGLPRESYTICSKIWVRPGGGLPEPERPDANIVIDRFRKELQTDYIDLVLIHCMEDPKWTDQQKKQMDIMADCKAKGIIKAHGVSIHCRRNTDLGALEACAASPWVDSVHARINAFGDSMDDKPELVAPKLKKIRDAGKGIVGMKLVGEGRYRNDPDKRDQSIKYVLGLGSVDVMIVGFEKTEEIDDFAARTKKALEARLPA